MPPRRPPGLRVSMFVLALALTACARGAAPSSEGQAYVTAYGCLTCHRIGSQGANVGPDLTYVGFRRPREWLDAWIKDPQALKPGTTMPNFSLRDEVRRSMVDYLASLKGQDYRTGSAPWDDSSIQNEPAKRGEVIFNRVGCTGCHGKAGADGFPDPAATAGRVPALAGVTVKYSPDALKAKIRDGAPHPARARPEGPAPIAMPAWGQTLKDGDIDALAAYLATLPGPDRGR